MPTNKERASWAEDALRHYVLDIKGDASHPDDMPDEIVDLMTDLMHLAKAKKLKPHFLLERAHYHYTEDVREEKCSKAS